jgi:methionine biosynthesis protein MetW
MFDQSKEPELVQFIKEDRNFASLSLLADLTIPIKNVLDCGSRDGALLRALGERRKVESLVALDWHNRVENGVEFISHNLETPLPFDDRSFDVVVCNDVLEHVELKKQLFSEILRCAGHYVVISLPNTQYWTYIRGLIKEDIGMSKHYNFLVEDAVDRHRWVTYYHQNLQFIEKNLGPDFDVVKLINTLPDKRVPLFLAEKFRKFFVFNQVFLIKRLG